MSVTLQDTASTSPITPDDPSHAIAPAGRAAWARDFAIVGGVSSFLAPFLVSGTFLGWPTLLCTAAAGALTGAILGALLKRSRAWLDGTPWALLGLLFLGIGAAWGAVVGALGSVVLTLGHGGVAGGTVEVFLFFMGCAAVAGAAQLAWFGVGYARAERTGRPTWPLLVAAAGTPFLGWAMIVLVGQGLRLAGGALGVR